MSFKEDGPLAVDLFYILKNLPWAFKFLKNCRKNKVEEIASSLANLLFPSIVIDNISISDGCDWLNNNIKFKQHFVNAIPLSISDLELSSAGVEVLTFDVTFTYDNWLANDHISTSYL